MVPRFLDLSGRDSPLGTKSLLKLPVRTNGAGGALFHSICWLFGQESRQRGFGVFRDNKALFSWPAFLYGFSLRLLSGFGHDLYDDIKIGAPAGDWTRTAACTATRLQTAPVCQFQHRGMLAGGVGLEPTAIELVARRSILLSYPPVNSLLRLFPPIERLPIRFRVSFCLTALNKALKDCVNRGRWIAVIRYRKSTLLQQLLDRAGEQGRRVSLFQYLPDGIGEAKGRCVDGLPTQHGERRNGRIKLGNPKAQLKHLFLQFIPLSFGNFKNCEVVRLSHD